MAKKNNTVHDRVGFTEDELSDLIESIKQEHSEGFDDSCEAMYYGWGLKAMYDYLLQKGYIDTVNIALDRMTDKL